MIGTNPILRTVQRWPRLKTDHARDMAAVDATLRQRFTELVSGSKRWPLMLYGPAGTGKTSAALALCDVAATACYLTPDELCDKIMRGDDPDLFDWIGSKELAVLDELGARERVGELHYGAVKRFADARQGKPTIYISNLTPRELLAIYDDRIYSRITAGTWFHLDGDDRRRQ